MRFAGATNTAFKFNDLNSTGTGFTSAYLLSMTNATGNILIEDNVFFSSFGVTAAGSSATLVGDGSVGGVTANYNDYYSSNSALSFWTSPTTMLQGLAAWQAQTAGDGHSITANPLWFNTAAGVEDFHPMSKVGRFLPAGGGPVVDGAESPTIDAGDPAEGVGSEPTPNGGRANQGSYGLTAEASETAPFIYPGCAAAYAVAAAGTLYDTISMAVAAMPASLPAGKSCVVIEDSSTYPEQVAVQNFTMNLSSIAIFADVGFTPTVSPPLNSTAAFVIANASVSVTGINIVPTIATMFGVSVSSPYVQISSVNVIDPGGLIATAGIMTSSWTTVSYASVTVGGANAAGFWLPGSTMTSVSFSTALAQTAGANWAALLLTGASSNTFIGISASNPAGYGHGS